MYLKPKCLILILEISIAIAKLRLNISRDLHIAIEIMYLVSSRTINIAATCVMLIKIGKSKNSFIVTIRRNSDANSDDTPYAITLQNIFQ